MIRVGVLTVSTSGARGERVDASGDIVKEMVAGIGGQIEAYSIVPDEREQIAALLRDWSDRQGLDLIVTTGGTGLSPTDVTPEATRDVLDKELPGLGETMRQVSIAKAPRAMLSRATAGARGHTLIVNLPGSPRGVRECLEAILAVLPHAVEILQDRPTDHR
ncbi:MAG TPA: MogA/MoaB family molybdenum cofactor biosynthesis protein [Chloroflexota bacterium]|nr:MogA/MoaB family molybdenum cofactor biosynthesis protein [Chloroflexota bacterium]